MSEPVISEPVMNEPVTSDSAPPRPGSALPAAVPPAGYERTDPLVGVDQAVRHSEGLEGAASEHSGLGHDRSEYDGLAHHGLLESVQSLLTIVTVAVFVITFIVQPFRIPSGSMEQTLLVGDFLLVNKQALAPGGRLWSWLLPYERVKRGDIIVFHYPVDPAIHLVKRVVGLPGDKLHLERGLVFVNGEQLHEPYAIYGPSHPDVFRDSFPATRDGDPGIEPQWWIEMHRYVQNGELTVPAGRYFVMGDNRNDSQDSRYWGFVPRESIVGQPWIIYFSLRHAGGDERSVLPAEPEPQHGGQLGFVVNSLEDLARWDRSFRVVR